MRLPRLAIENHQFTNTLISLLILSGIISFMTMPRSEDPQVSPPGSTIVLIYPGANPADMEELIIDPIEESLNELEDIKDIKSSAQDGLAVIAIEFFIGADPEEKYNQVVQQVNSIRSTLPQEISTLDIKKWSVTDVQILQLALGSHIAGYRQLEKEGERLKKMLERVSGVKQVKMWAYPEQEIRITLDFEKMAHNHISLQQVSQVIQGSNQNIPGGYLDIGNRRFNIQTSGSYETLDDIQNTVVHSYQGKLVYLKDIANVSMSYEDDTYYARFMDQKTIFITVSQKKGTNIFSIRNKISDELGKFSERLSGNMQLTVIFDQTESVARRLNTFFLNLLQGLFLVGLVVFISIGFRASLIVMMVIPLSITIGINFVDWSGFGLEQISIAGLVIALGLLVDNAIVVTENIARFKKMGYKNSEAAVEGTGQIAWAIVSSTVTTVLAFVPMMMMFNMTGEFIRGLPVTVVFTLSASLLLALVLTPYLSSKFIPREAVERRSSRITRRIIEKYYRPMLNYVLTHPKRILVIIFIILLMSIGLFPMVGISFFPKAEKPQFLINIDTPQGSSLAYTDSIAHHVEKILSDEKDIKHLATNIGHGNPRIYYNTVPKNITSNHAQIYVELNYYDENVYTAMIRRLRTRLSDNPGARIEVKEFEQGPPVDAPVLIRVLGENITTLKSLASQVESLIKETEGTINVSNPLRTARIDLHLAINRAKAAILGLNLFEIDRTVRAAIAGLPVSRYRDMDGKEYQIVIHLPRVQKEQLQALHKIFINSRTGNPVPLMQVANVQFKESPIEINHYNLERSVSISADVVRSYSVNDVTLGIIKKLDQLTWPKGYRYAIGGESESREESFGGMYQAVLIAFVGIFGVLVLQFRSYLQPFIVFSAIPLAIIGSILALLITGNTFSFTAFIGLTSLVGIVINNSIILVDYTNQLRQGGVDTIHALKEAGETRFLPIILTTATTVGGLLPLTLGGGTLWAPMGWTIIGGLTLSTLLTLLVVPMLYLLLEKGIAIGVKK